MAINAPEAKPKGMPMSHTGVGIVPGVIALIAMTNKRRAKLNRAPPTTPPRTPMVVFRPNLNLLVLGAFSAIRIPSI